MTVFQFDNSYARDLEGFYVPWQGARVPRPEMLRFNLALAEDLGLDADALNSDQGAAILSGSQTPAGATPLAMAYAGHQFGNFSPQLGDGRALLIGEVIDRTGRRRDIHLKGSGRTPFSRGGDGKAVLGPVLREYLLGEAMHALGIPTTRALAVVTTGEAIMRDGAKTGAVLARVAASHLRVGTFQFFAARGETERLRQLADYAIDRHFPQLSAQADRYIGLLRCVCVAQAALVAKWMLAGFVHGVMNTDNMTISGETIDYGPCAFIDSYDPRAVFSSIDQFGRYAFGNQPVIAQWNLARFAETLIGLIRPDDPDLAVRLATEEIEGFVTRYSDDWMQGMRSKLGLSCARPEDHELVQDLLAAMAEEGIDFTRFFRRLAAALRSDGGLADVFDQPSERTMAWLSRYAARCGHETLPAGARAEAMDRVNPIYIPRNHLVEEALQAAESGDPGPFDALLAVLGDPHTSRAGLDRYAHPAPPAFGRYTTYCGT